MRDLTRRGFARASAATIMAAVLSGCSLGSLSNKGSSGASSKSPASAKSSSAAPAKGILRFVTGDESGTYYSFGAVIAQHVSSNTDVTVTTLVGNGSQSNVLELEDTNADLAFCQSDVMSYAYAGTNLFEDMPITCFSVVAALYDEQVQIVTCDESIKTVSDLLGKRVSIGTAGSGVYFNACDILDSYGITEDDIEPSYSRFGSAAIDLEDGLIDAAFIVAGAPTPAIEGLAGAREVHLVALDDEHIGELIESSPYYSQSVIPAGTYPGQAADVKTVSVNAVILANDTADEDDVYAFVSDIFENTSELTDAPVETSALSVEKGASVTSVPYHPGAARYFAEKGLDVAVK